MASLRVPKRHYKGLAKLLLLPDETTQELISALESAPLTLEIRETLEGILSRADTIRPNDVQSVTDALMSLYTVRANSEDSPSDLVTDLARAIEKADIEGVTVTDEFRATLAPRLTRLLEVNNLILASKAISIMFEHDSVFFKARVVTDLRPVFGTNTETPQAAIIVHNLRIHYHRGDEHKDFFIAMDAQDLDQLMKTLQRAKAKTETLKGVLSAASIPYIEPDIETE